MASDIQGLIGDALDDKLTRRQIMRRGAALGLSVPLLGGLLAACGGGSDEPTPAGSGDGGSGDGGTSADTTPSSGSSDAPATETGDDDAPAYDHVVIVQGAEVRHFDPTIRPTSSDAHVQLNIYDTLTKLDENFDVAPNLAVSWELVDNTTWEFKLREGVQFHNGEPFNADTLVAWYDRLVQVPEVMQGENSSLQQIDAVTAIEKVDEYTVQFKTSRPYPVLPRNLAVYFMMIPASRPFQEDGPEALRTQAVGTGPYKLVEWVKDDHLLLEANDDYWGGKPKIRRLEYRPIPEPSGRAAALLAGEAQVADAVPIASFPEIEASDEVELRTVPLAAWYFWVQINARDVEEFKDVRVRQALNYAVDKQAIIDNVLAGMGISSGAMVPREAFGYKEIPNYPYDPEKAKALLAEAGYPDGFACKFYYSPGRYLADTEVVQAIASYLNDVGIQVELITNEWANHLALNRQGKLDGLIYGGKTILSIDADYQFAELQPDKNFGWSYPLQGRAQELYLQEREEMDEAKRAELCGEILQLYFEEAGIIFLWQPIGVWGVAKDLKWSPPGDGFILGYHMS